jgi:hypothetical protein
VGCSCFAQAFCIHLTRNSAIFYKRWTAGFLIAASLALWLMGDGRWGAELAPWPMACAAQQRQCMTEKLTLISHELCPYLQSAVIVLFEKQMLCGRIDIDLANKPAWFLKHSPLGKNACVACAWPSDF